MIYNRSPLPFVGQKRGIIKKFQKILEENLPDCGEGFTIIDAYGGSGLLAHNAKKICPHARVIYNDFDYFIDRIRFIDQTNDLRRRIVQAIGNLPPKSEINNNDKQKIINVINSFNGFIDIKTLSSWLLFSLNTADDLKSLFKKRWFCKIPRYDLNALDYLAGVEVVHMDAVELLKEHYHNKKALFLLDPPYISTLQEAYNNSQYFGMNDFLNLIIHTRPPFLLFSSNKSEIPEFIKLIMENKTLNYEIFNNHSCMQYNNNISNENLIYNFVD